MSFRFVYLRGVLAGILCSIAAVHTVAAKQVVDLATGPDYAPYVSSELLEGGVVSEVVTRVFTEMGYRPKLGFYPWNRAYQRVLNVQSDATFPYAWGLERSKLFYYSRPVNRINIRVFMHQHAAFTFTGANDLAGLSYCQPLGYQTEPELRDMIKQARLKRFEARDMDGCFQMLSAKRVDFVVSNDQVGWSSVKRGLDQEAGKMIVAAEEPFRTISEYLIISKQHPEGKSLIKAFNAAYEVLLEDGSLDQIWMQRLGRHAKAVD